ncbi:MAG TPA: hypothetical protein VNN21_07310, partial [Dehalococcoidia bacterium]|nr:hypothetical protein [Dehalococcoidia bacterium]
MTLDVLEESRDAKGLQWRPRRADVATDRGSARPLDLIRRNGGAAAQARLAASSSSGRWLRNWASS